MMSNQKKEMKVIIKNFSYEGISLAANIKTWSNQPVAEFLNKVINPKDADRKIFRLKDEQIKEIEEKLGSKPKVPASFKEIYQQFKNVKLGSEKPKGDVEILDVDELRGNEEETYKELQKGNTVPAELVYDFVSGRAAYQQQKASSQLEDGKGGSSNLYVRVDWDGVIYVQGKSDVIKKLADKINKIDYSDY